MKTLGLLVTILFAVSANAELTTYRCTENTKPSGLESQRKYSVVVKELEDITNNVSFGKHYDSVYRVSVTVSLQRAPYLQPKVIKSFTAISTSEDVVYEMSSVKANGLKFWNFLDEPDQAGIELIENGRRTRVNLTCDWQ